MIQIQDLFLCNINLFLQETPQGQLPILTIDGANTLPQSLAIARYLAREFGKQLAIVYIHVFRF